MAGTHARLSASGAERWMNCAGSAALTRKFKAACDASNVEKEYTIEGTGAHEVGGLCLANDTDAWFYIGQKVNEGKVLFDAEMSEHVQTYLDHVRSFGYSHLTVETTIVDPDLSTDFGGTADCYADEITEIDEGLQGLLHVFDYKHGEGIVVEIDESTPETGEGNPQLKYYAFGVMRKIMRERALPYDCDVSNVMIGITIVQPRAFHEEGPIRDMWISGADLMAWGNNELLPAMARTEAPDAPLKAGEWCRFCPVKTAMLCPLLNAQFAAMAEASERDPESMSDEALAVMFEYSDTVKMTIKALGEEIFRRNTTRDGKLVPGTKMVPKKSDRVWKDGAEAKARAEFGDEVMTAPKMKSPAQFEKDFGSAGKKFASAEGYKPDKGLTVALVSDKRTGVEVKSLAAMFSNVKL